MSGIIPADARGRVVTCRYCGTECADEEARKGHEAICDHNPETGVLYARAEEARAALAAKK